MEPWEGLSAHYTEAIDIFPADRIVCIALQGSQNYGLATETSDIDTKLLVAPTLKEVAMNKQPVSYTHVRTNNEHTDWKDVRLYIDLFKHQNPNFMEILFTEWFYVGEPFQMEWKQLLAYREDIAHLNPYRSMHALYGMMKQKYHALEHPYPSKMDLIKTYGYDGKQLSHMCRLHEFMWRYYEGEDYKDCLDAYRKSFYIYLKQQGPTLDEARELAAAALKGGQELLDRATQRFKNEDNKQTLELLDDVKYTIVKTSLERELRK